MLKRVSVFIVNKRRWIAVLMIALVVVSGFLMQKVEKNEDMTKYLPDDSSMKAGADIMANEFPEMETTNTIRVMFDDLTAEQKVEIQRKLDAIPYTDSVTHEDSAEYNKDNHTLYVIGTTYDFGSKEELSVEKALDEDFGKYSMVWHADDTGTMEIPAWIMIVAVSLLMVILFVMCGSWIEPLLFLAVISAAIVINMGTNIFMGSVSDITFSIAAILQLVLSMDYSIILINRYRQERELAADKETAMKNALTNAFSSIASSSLTTVVGLLMLVFMSFKIGMDLGIVLAKGVFISMVCVLTMLPGVILAFDKLIVKTAKKSPHIPMGWAAAFSYKLRYVIGVFFLIFFIGACFLQTRTGIAYTLARDDPVASVFPADNTLVMVYENKDEDKVAELAAELEENDNIKSVNGYSTTLAKPCTAEELAAEISEMDSGMGLDVSVIKMLYYDYFNGTVQPMTASGFLRFLSDTVLKNETFAGYIDEDMRDRMDMLDRFSEKTALTAPMTADELADFFDMEKDDIQELVLFYTIKNGGVPAGSMTLPAFTDFVLNEVASDETYGSMFDEKTLSQMHQLAGFTNAEKMNAPVSYTDIASLTGMDADTVKLLFIYYYALSDSYTPGTMTLPEFVTFLQSDVMNDDTFASFIDDNAKAQISQIAMFTDKTALEARHTPAELAELLGMDENIVNTIFASANAQDADGSQISETTMSLSEMVHLILADPAIQGFLDEETVARLTMIQGLIEATQSGMAFSYSELSTMLGMDSNMLKMVFTYHDSKVQMDSWRISMKALVDFLLNHREQFGSMISGAQFEQLQMTQELINASANGTLYSAKGLADLLGISEDQVQQLYLLYISRHGDTSGWTLSVKEFVDFVCSDILSDPDFSDQFDDNTAELLYSTQSLVDAVLSGKTYTAGEMSELLAGLSGDLDTNMVELLYLYASSENADLAERTMSVETLFRYLTDEVLDDARFSKLIDDKMRSDLLDAKAELDDGKAQLVSDRYSRLIITTSYLEESPETTAFLDALNARCEELLTGEYHFVGNSAMVYEMQKIFDKELTFITLLTAFAIFLIVALTFRSLFIPLLLVLVVQAGVYATVSVVGFNGGSMYYLALLIVECILMGATIDYGILFTNYYRENRVSLPVKDALKAAYAGSVHTILTSGLILILVTAIVGNFFKEPTVSAIVGTISIGALFATILILFVLPGLLALCDKFVCRKKKQ